MAEKEKKEVKMFGVFDYAKKLNREFSSNSFVRKADIIPGYRRLATGALGMDYPLFGGFPYGRVFVFSGKEHSGKTTGAFAALAAYQRENPDRVCVFCDVEQSLDLEFQALMNGVDLSKLLVMEPEVGMSGEQILATILELQQNTNDIGFIVLDSIPALETAQNLSHEFEKDMGKQGTIAKSLAKFLKQIIPSLREKQNCLALINQVRVKDVLYNGAPVYDEPGGSGPKFYGSVNIRFGTRVYMKGDQESGTTDGTGADGFRIKFSITKNKTAATNRGGGFITYRYLTGMDKVSDLFDIATSFDFIHKINNQTYQLINLETGELLYDDNGKELKGYRKVLKDYILTHEKFRNTYIQMLTEYISASNTKKENSVQLLDSDSLQEILDEEKTMEARAKKQKAEHPEEDADSKDLVIEEEDNN